MRENSGRLLQLAYAPGLDEIVCRYRVERGHGALRVSGFAQEFRLARRRVRLPGFTDRSGAALRGDGLFDQIDARLRGRRLRQRRAECERDGECNNTQHDSSLVA